MAGFLPMTSPSPTSAGFVPTIQAMDSPYLRRRFRTSSWRGIKFLELVERPASPEEELRDDGSRAVRTYFCMWHDRTELRKVMLGWPKVVEAGGVKHISRQTPHFHPDWKNSAGKPVLFATSFQRVEPWGMPDINPDGSYSLHSPVHVAQYGLAKVSVVYESLPYDILEDPDIKTDGTPDESRWLRYVEVTGQFSGGLRPLPFANFRYAGTTQPVPGTSSYTEIKGELVVIWKRVPVEAVGSKLVNPGAATFPQDEALGRVNNAPFPTGAANPFRTGTLLLLGVRPVKIRSAILDRLVDIEYRFSVFDRGNDNLGNPAGHNHLLRVPDGATNYEFREVVAHDAGVAGAAASNFAAKADGKNPHNWYDFSKLFKPA